MRAGSFLLLPALLACPVMAGASTPIAGAAGDRAAIRACGLAAGLRAPSFSGPILFSDQSGKTALLVTGTYPQRFMKGATGSMLCLFDRHTGRAEASETPGWQVP